MNLYSNKQKWKIALLIFALLTVGASLFISNNIVSKVGDRERDRAQQWADAIKKKIELVRLTNSTFSQLRDLEREKMTLWVEATKEVSKMGPLDVNFENNFPLDIIDGNKNIPVVVLDDDGNYSSSINAGFTEDSLSRKFPEVSNTDISTMFEDSMIHLAENWAKKNPSFSIEIFEGYYMTYYYNDSKEIVKLERERDSLIDAFHNDLINNEGLVPVLLVDTKTLEILGTNINEYEITTENLQQYITELSAQNDPLIIDFKDGNTNTLYFDDSPELKQLQFFPYIQFIVIGLFAFIGYLIFSTYRKAEQNQVWAGMAKETAHQLGTPLSSLIGWIQLLESQGVDPMVTTEMQKDVDRLEMVTDRFSKIGSGAHLEDLDVNATVQHISDYLRPRISDKVDFKIVLHEEACASHNASLIEWVVENISKNAVDAMEGVGELIIEVHTTTGWVNIDIKDTGKGIPTNQLKTIFEPGFSTKKRGWGLGLSLVKRIVKEYHKGNVFVLESQVGVGTTFRITLPSDIL
ncbi:MAG: HAMP domain-containing sensor histidine kinase [Crocinitomicaceae bacterium]|nr:HAMP domain-containing sensor histidine kinase [Crocinitomicaceae bacterium]